MAEWKDVIHQIVRICKLQEGACGTCVLSAESCQNSVRFDLGDEAGFVNIEETIMTWAAEHPERVYPSVAKYLERLGIIIRRDGTLEADFFKAHEPMSADVAKLLGVDLVEDENEKAD